MSTKAAQSENLSVAVNRASKIAKMTGERVAVYDGKVDGHRMFLCIPERDVTPADHEHIMTWLPR